MPGRGKTDEYANVTYDAEKGHLHGSGANAFDLYKGQSGYGEALAKYKQNQSKKAQDAANKNVQNVVNKAGNNQDLLTNVRGQIVSDQTRHHSRFEESDQEEEFSTSNPEISAKPVIKKTSNPPSTY
jgi:hypothetical protein